MRDEGRDFETADILRCFAKSHTVALGPERKESRVLQFAPEQGADARPGQTKQQIAMRVGFKKEEIGEVASKFARLDPFAHRRAKAATLCAGQSLPFAENRDRTAVFHSAPLICPLHAEASPAGGGIKIVLTAQMPV